MSKNLFLLIIGRQSRVATADEYILYFVPIIYQFHDCYWHNHSTVVVQSDIFRRVRKIAKGDYQLRHVRPSVMEQLGSQSTEFHEFQYLSILKKSVQKIPSFIKIWQQ